MSIVEMAVHMDCGGCESKIRKALIKIEGVDNVDIDMVTQKVTVTGYVEQKKILKAVRKTGRRAVLWPYPYNNSEYSQNHHLYYNQHHPTESNHHYAFSVGDSFTTPSSSYNYRKHGYDDSDTHGYYPRPAYSSIFDDRAGTMFSDDNPHACSIM